MARPGAQVMGQIAGTVRDVTGAVLPDARVTVRGAAISGDITVVSDAAGRYLVAVVPPGMYEVAADLAGFTPVVRTAVAVSLNERVTVDFVLSVTSITESVRVTPHETLVEAATSELTARVNLVALDALPLNGRNFTDLIALTPGTRPTSGDRHGAGISLFGERGATVSFLVDGSDNNDPLEGGAATRLSQDAIAEFEVMASGYRAEFGRAQGGIVNVVTRSGANTADGAGFWFGRNDRWDASNVAGQPAPSLDRHQFGAVAGGPIRKDRVFIFGTAEWLDEERGLNLDRSTIPAFVISGLASPGGREDFSIEPDTEGVSALVKTDLVFSPRRRMAVSIARATNDVGGELSSPVAGTIALPSAARTGDMAATAIRLNSSLLVGDRAFVESSAAYVRASRGSNVDRAERAEPLLILLRSGFLQTGAPFGGRSRRGSSRAQAAQAITRVADTAWGLHQLKAGWDASRVSVSGFDEVVNDVEYSAAFLSPEAHAVMADRFTRLGFEQSAARFFTLPAAPDGRLVLDLHNTDAAAFVQDTWQPAAAVTIDAGLRFDWASLFGDDRNNLAPRLGVAWDVGGRQRTVVRTNWGVFFDRNLLAAAASVPEKGGFFTRSAFDVALPRLGFDYTDSLIDLVITSGFPIPGGRTPPENAVYAAFAEALRRDPLALYSLLGIAVSDPSAPPVVTADNVERLSGRSAADVVAVLESTFPGTDWEFFDVPGGSIVGDRVLSFFPRGPLSVSRDVSRYGFDQTPWTRAFSAALEQQIGRDWSVGLTYVHRRTRDLLTRRIVNLFDVPPGDPRFGRTADGGPRISQVTYDGRIDYDGLVLEARRRFRGRYQLGLSYTASRARDNLLTGDVGSTFSHNNRPELDEGPSNLSAPHSLVAHGVVEAPAGVQASGVVSWRSGAAFNPRGVRDLDGDGLVDQRDTTEPRNRFRTDAFARVDLRVAKAFRVSADQTLRVMLEAFNLTNRANVVNVIGVAGPEFGRPAAFFPGREVQVGVRYEFGR